LRAVVVPVAVGQQPPRLFDGHCQSGAGKRIGVVDEDPSAAAIGESPDPMKWLHDLDVDAAFRHVRSPEAIWVGPAESVEHGIGESVAQETCAVHDRGS
jgi:hypothetical protein